MRSHRAGIALLNMGSPATPGEVRVFLSRLFMDPDLISLPGGSLLRPLWASLISSLRAPRVRRRYQVLGGASPLLEITRQQASALEAALSRRGAEAAVEVCMRYSRPSADEALDRLAGRGVDTVIGLPLYPQYSRATSGSSLRDLREARLRRCPGLAYLEIEHWYDLAGYQGALARRIIAAQRSSTGSPTTGLVFVAHSLPASQVRRGDPYVTQVEATVQGILQQLQGENWEPWPWFLAYQGQVGPVRWVGPPVVRVLEVMVQAGLKRAVVVPVSFVSDHLETLYEIDLEYRRLALEMGLERFERIPSLNDSEDFIEAIAGLVLARMS